MPRLSIFCLILLLVVLSGCSAKEEATEAAGTMAEATPAETTIEEYVEVDPSELAFSMEDFYYEGMVTSEGMEPTGGEVGKFLCEGQALELASNEFIDGFIVTKEYGKVKILFTTHISGSSFSVWLTPTQKKAMLSLKTE